MKQRRSHRGHGGPPDILARKPPATEERALELVRALPPTAERTDSNKDTCELAEGLMQDAYEIAMKFSHQWYEDAADCWGVAQLAIVRAVRAIDPARITHGRQVFALMQRCVENALFDYIKTGRQFCEGKPTRKTLTALDWIDPAPEDDPEHSEHPDFVRKKHDDFVSKERSKSRQIIDVAGAELRQLAAPRPLADLIRDILECCNEDERQLAKDLIDAFHEHGDNISAVAKEMGIDRKTVRNLREALRERYYGSTRLRILKILSDDDDFVSPDSARKAV